MEGRSESVKGRGRRGKTDFGRYKKELLREAERKWFLEILRAFSFELSGAMD